MSQAADNLIRVGTPVWLLGAMRAGIVTAIDTSDATVCIRWGKGRGSWARASGCLVLDRAPTLPQLWLGPLREAFRA